MYDEQGRLLGEYSPEGKLIAETIWFDGLPVATIRPQGANNQTPLGIVGTGKGTANNTGTNSSADPVYVDIFYVHPDHLGTPRVATRSVAVNGATTGPNAINKAVWRWDSDPFGSSIGNSKPNENPQNVTGTASQLTAASFRVNNRFPGQIADAESGKYYNYFRDYDPAIGRYVESDPIGLRGGINTFGYVGQRPTKWSDPRGLWIPAVHNDLARLSAIRGGCSKRATEIGNLTAAVDDLPGSQEAENAFWHAMCDGTSGQTAAEGIAAYSAYMNGLSKSCAIKDLARALHAMQDSFAPAHSGCKPWYGMGNALWNRPGWELIWHGLQDLAPDTSQSAAMIEQGKSMVERWKRSCACTSGCN